ncbi:hypothetical protein [Streptomyces roseifaciens]|uniref:hypothetical protein n=1 Tax=Streptomyces roseifaciens TaxID=1488406 RepID=UPI00136675B4
MPHGLDGQDLVGGAQRLGGALGEAPAGAAVPSMSSVTGRHRRPGLVLTDHHFDVPLDHDAPSGEHIRI